MTAQTNPSRAPNAAANPTAATATLADVVVAVRAAELPDRQRQELIAALNTAGRVLGRTLEQIPAEPTLLRRRLAEANPLAQRITRRRWNNVRSLLETCWPSDIP